MFIFIIVVLIGGRLDCCGEDSGKDNCEIFIFFRVDDLYFS